MGARDYDVVVVGSGFGGGVAALRYAQAGHRVAVLEQGRRVTRADVEAGARSTRRLLWLPAAGLRGYFAQAMLRHVTVVHGVGVGGGSLVYAAVLLEPRPPAWTAPGWTDTGLDWAAELAPHFEQAARMLGRRPATHRSAQDVWLQQAAHALGVGETYGPTLQGIDAATCIGCGGCITGCPTDAKATVATTYLRKAEDLGAVVLSGTKAEVLVPLPGGGWRLDCVDPLRRDRPAGSVTAREVVLACGVLGTTRLLLASRDRYRTLPDLPAALGRHVRTNSEAFTAVLQPPGGPDVCDGPTISSDFWPDASTHVTNNRFPRSYGFMRLYLSPLVDGATRGERLRRTLAAMARDPRGATANLWARDWHRRITVLTVMQHDDNELALTYRRTRVGWRLASRLAPGAPPVPSYLPQASAAGRAVAAASGGRAYGTLMDPLLGVGATAHILGGAVIAATPRDGVVDTDQRVFAGDSGAVYDDLRIMDGSVVPANVGVNPSLTITALAERAMARRLATGSGVSSGTESSVGGSRGTGQAAPAG